MDHSWPELGVPVMACCPGGCVRVLAGLSVHTITRVWPVPLEVEGGWGPGAEGGGGRRALDEFG